MSEEDLVQELRNWQAIIDEAQGKVTVVMLSGEVFGAAADEIERLEARLHDYTQTGIDAQNRLAQRPNFRPNQPLIEFLGVPGLDEGMEGSDADIF